MKTKLIILVTIICLLTAGCVYTGARIDPASTTPPDPTPTPEPTPEPTPVPEIVEMADLSSAHDKLGMLITTADHFKRYITFKDIQVYEQHGDTFMDAIAVNEYPLDLVCAVNITFFDAEGQIIAQSRVQTRDGKYVLKLCTGDNTLFARIDTDIKLTDKEFKLEFSEELDVLPQ